jgi:SAM-dependent methyltransferase
MAILIHPTRATHDILHIGVRKGDRMYHVLSDVAGAAGGDELRAFVRGCGMRPAWVQYAGTYREHFDAHAHLADCLMRRGARLVTNREVGLLLRAKRGHVVAAPPARPAAREVEPVPDALAAPWWGTVRGVAGEGQLRVLGEVAGRDVLELDPPDAEAGAALARQGARYASVARHDLPGVAAEAYDVVFARRATLDGVADLPDALGALARALRPGGIAAVCAVSPFAGIFPTGGADPLRPERSYFDRTPRTGADGVAHYHHTVGDWVAAFAFAGLIVTDLLELEPHPRLWRPGAAAEPPWEQLAMLPHTTIWRARKPGGAPSGIAG